MLVGRLVVKHVITITIARTKDIVAAFFDFLCGLIILTTLSFKADKKAAAENGLSDI